MTNAEIEKKLMELEALVYAQNSTISSLKYEIDYNIRNIERVLDRHLLDAEAAKDRWIGIGIILFGLAVTGAGTWAVVSGDNGHIATIILGSVILSFGIYSLMG